MNALRKEIEKRIERVVDVWSKDVADDNDRHESGRLEDEFRAFMDGVGLAPTGSGQSKVEKLATRGYGSIQMKTSRFSESQIVAILSQASSGAPVPTLSLERAISSSTFYNWRSKYGGMDASMLRR